MLGGIYKINPHSLHLCYRPTGMYSAGTRKHVKALFSEGLWKLGAAATICPLFACLFLLKYFIKHYGGSSSRFRMYSFA